MTVHSSKLQLSISQFSHPRHFLSFSPMWILYFGLLWSLVSPATSNAEEVNNSAPQRARNNTLTEEGLSTTSYDLNKDGKDDQFHLRKGGEIYRIVRDLNFDGRIDVYEHFENGLLVEEELDLDLDGKIDAVRIYNDGKLRERHYSTGFLQHMSISQWYDEAGQLVRVERDTDDDLKTDTWEHFRAGEEKPYKVERDTNGDGIPNEIVD